MELSGRREGIKRVVGGFKGSVQPSPAQGPASSHCTGLKPRTRRVSNCNFSVTTVTEACK